MKKKDLRGESSSFFNLKGGKIFGKEWGEPLILVTGERERDY